MEYTSFDSYMKQRFGGKVYRLSLSTGCTCPNRDGSCGTGGCIFCSAGGSGEFAAPSAAPINVQIEEAKRKVASKLSHSFAGYMAYFQSFTNTYFHDDKEFEDVKARFFSAARHPEVVAVAIATRPDCLPQQVLDMLAALNSITPVLVELGLQTIHDGTARLINRGYETWVYDKAVRDLHAIGIGVVTHMIVGLPGETEEMMMDTLRHIVARSSASEDSVPGDGSSESNNSASDVGSPSPGDSGSGVGSPSLGDSGSGGGSPSPYDSGSGVGSSCSDSFVSVTDSFKPMPDGIKIQLLHVLRNTRLNEMIKAGDVNISEYSLEQYAELLGRMLPIIPKNVVVHRLTGDPPKSLLVSPLWTADKKRVLNTIRKTLED